MDIVDVARMGGLASAASLTAKERTERARKAATAKWAAKDGRKRKGRAKRKAE